MKSKVTNRWDVTPAEARQVQLSLRDKVELEDRIGKLCRIAGADMALDLAKGEAIAGVVVYSFPSLKELERVSARKPLVFPYIPGLLSFREMPAILAAFEQVRNEPDLIFYDGHGYAHPRRFGIACHLGVLTGLPSIGVAKSRLVGNHGPLPSARGAWVPLLDDRELIGAVLRTRAGVSPVYVSVGHRVCLATAIRYVMACCTRYRLPETTRLAHHLASTK